MENQSTTVRYDSGQASVATDLDNDYFSSPLQLTTVIDNTTSKTITVSFRNGLCFEVAPSPIKHGRAVGSVVTITQYIKLGPSVKFDVRHILNAPDSELTPEQLQIKKSTTGSNFDVRMQPNRIRHLEWRYEVSLKDIDVNTGTLYLNNLDLQLSTQEKDKSLPHPFSLAAAKLNHQHRVAESGLAGFIYAVEIVDNNNLYGDRYINLLGNVYKVAKIDKPGHACGVYFTVSGKGTDGIVTSSTETEFVPFTEHDTHPLMRQLYLTYADAEAHGDVVNFKEKEYKLEISRLQYEIQQSKLQLAREQAEVEKDKRILEIQQERQNLMQKQLDYEQAERLARLKEEKEERSYRRKEHYEERQNNRKDATEMFKMIPIIIAFILAIKPFIVKK
jgi:hypothetical protein